MNFKTFQKFVLTVIIIMAMASVGIAINRTVVTRKVDIPQEDTNGAIIKVSISGAVANEGTYAVKEGIRVCDVIYAAGGIVPGADTERVNLDAVVTDKMKIVIPYEDSDYNPDAVMVVNINEADVNTLCLVPGIGETIAQGIVDYRKENGAFKSVDELRSVKGIGNKKLNEIKDYIVTEETQE